MVRLELPPLRARREDIPLLVGRIIDRMNRLRGRSVAGLEPEPLARLMAHDFPGNIRELENIIEHGFILCTGERIGLHHLPANLQAPAAATQLAATAEPPDLRAVRAASEEEAIRAALERTNYNRLAAARELGMHKATLFRKIKKLNLDLPPIDGRSSRPAS